MRIFILALLAVGAGCTTPARYAISEGNYLTYDHPFTEAAAQAALTSAEKQCAQRKQVAIKTNSACSLTRCTTHFQCIDKSGAAGYLQRSEKQ